MNSYFLKLIVFLTFLSCVTFAGDFLLYKSSPLFDDSAECFDSAYVTSNATNNLNQNFDRINLWPLFYSHKSRVSILWPSISYNEDGNACYPIYSHYYNQEFNLLWPLASIGLSNHSSRILNTYWFDDEFTFFPFFFKDYDFWLAPLVGGYSSNQWYSVMPPLWIHWPKERSWFFAPTFTYLFREYNDDNNQQLKLQSFGVWPLYSQIEQEQSFFQYFLGSFRYIALDDSKSNVFQSAHLLFPLYFDYNDQDIKCILTPLYGSLYAQDAKCILTPLYGSLNAQDTKCIITPLYGSLNAQDASAFFTPIFSAGNIEDSDFVNLLGLAYHQNINTNENESYFHFMWPLFSQWRNLGQHPFYETSVAWPIFNFSQFSNKSHSLSIFPLFGYDIFADPREEFLNHPTSVYRNGLSARKKQIDVLIFPWLNFDSGVVYSENIDVKIPAVFFNTNFNNMAYSARHTYDYKKIPANSNLWQEFVVKRFVSHDYVRHSFWPLWAFDKTSDCALDFSIFEYLYSYNLNKLKDTSKSRFLWQFIRYDRSGDNKSLDVFPFITYDKHIQSKNSKLSVFWRMFSYQKEADKTKLYLFFIPF